MPAPGAVFLSYASQDAEAARRISDALRAAGVEVWFDQSELRGGDAWDQKIRRQIKECALFVPIISANTQARLEGYFRLEWLLAVERSRLMAEEKAFLVPVVIDDTSDAAASVPERFRDVQWIRLSGSDTSSQFCERVNVLLAGELGARTSKSAPEMRARTPALPGRRRWLALGIAAAVTGVALAFWQPWKKTPAAAASVAPSSGTETAAPLTAAQKLTRQARALIDDDFLAVRENFRLAEELCQRATTLDPSDAEAWATHARVSVEMMKRNYDSSAARREAARSQAERAIRLAPASLEAGLAVAAHALQLHDAAEAERRYRSVLTTAPREARAAIGLAHALEAGGRISEASEIRLHHPAFASPHPVPLVDEARRLRFRGQLIEAEAFLDRAQAIAPTVGGYHAKLVILANYWGDVPAAVDYLKQIPLRILQEDAIAALSAWVWMRVGNGDEALKAMARVPRDFIHEGLQVNPKSWVTGWAQTVAGRPTAARAEWTEALAVVEKRLVTEPNEPRLLFLKAHLLALTGRTEPAEQTWKLYREFAGRSTHALDEVDFYCALGRHDEAIGHLESWWRSGASRVVSAAWNVFRFEPRFAAIRKDARVQTILAVMVTRIDALRRPATPAAGSNHRDAGTARPAAADKSVAILPFANLSPDPENAFFADGVHEDVITNLAKIRDLKVISRTSTLAYRDAAQRNLRRIAEELGVASVLEGSVRRAGNKVRVTAQLIDARTDQHLWAETYDRELSDVFAVQAALAQEIAGALKVGLTAGERASISRATTRSVDAYDAYLRAQLLRQSIGPGNSKREQWEEVIELYERALARDPGFTMAQVQLADVEGIMYRFPHLDSSPARMARARGAMEAVERLAPGSPEAFYARGLFAYYVENDWERARVALQKAELALPNDSRLSFTLGLANQRLGRWQDERVSFERAFALDPKNHDAAVILAGVLFRNRRYLEVLELARRKETILAGEAAPVVVARAQFAVDGDVPAFRRTVAAPLRGRDAELYREYTAALDARDFAAALRVISGNELAPVFHAIDRASLFYVWSADSSLLASVGGDASLNLRRAQVAWLTGDATMARQFAQEAIALCTRNRRNPRETSMAFRGVALAEAFAGRQSAALSAIEQAIASTNEAHDVELARGCLGKINVILGRVEEAVAGLREMMAGPCSVSPNEIRADPVWSRLKDDPRFEEILKSAKPF